MAPRRERAGAGGVILILLLGQCLWPLFTTPQAQQRRWLVEGQAVHATFGQALGGGVVHAGLSAGEGLRSFVPAQRFPSAASRGQSHDAVASGAGMGGAVLDHVRRYVLSVSLQLQIFILRTTVVAIWTVGLLPILLATVVDGLVQRKVKLASLGFQNPTAFALARAALWLVGLLPVLYAALPFDVPMGLVPLAVMMLFPPVCLALRHMQPVFTR